MFIQAEDVVPVSDENRVFFRIPLKNYDKFEREIERLSKRTEKATGFTIDIMKMGTVRDKKSGRDFFEVYLDAPDVTLDGYKFLARLDHSQETGNIIRMLPNVKDELPAVYRTVAPKCDHCKVNRMRRDTFVLVNEETGALVQLGSTCMGEFFTTDPRIVAKLAELGGYAREVANAAQDDDYLIDGEKPRGLRDLRSIPLHEYLTYCAAVKRIDGRFKPSAFRAESTKMVALDTMYGGPSMRMRYAITAEDEATVEKALAWVDGLAERRDAGENLSQYEHNVLVVGQALVIEGRAAGLAASIVGCFDRPVPAWKLPKPVVEPKPELVLSGMMGMIELFRTAGSKLKWPKVTISFPDTGEIVLSVAGPSSQYPGTINVKSTGSYDNATWYGRIHLDGRWEPTRSRSANLPEGLELALVKFAADPAGVAAEYGKRTGNCCFCHKGLTDPKSAAVGYGATCAKNFNLPYGVKAMRDALAA